jgi:2-polyprenyl-6-hydroxyphenyl methylase/3-demethylubiquinone-9 3-methyltransferase
VVLALEIIEHVTNPQGFVNDCAKLCKPSGIIIFSTLNRTAKSFALAKVAAEYVLGWVPAGTHDWKKFIKPSELSKMVRNAGGQVQNVEGMIYNPVTGAFKRDAHAVDVNYFLTHLKA